MHWLKKNTSTNNCQARIKRGRGGVRPRSIFAEQQIFCNGINLLNIMHPAVQESSINFLKVTVLETSCLHAVHKIITIWPLVAPNDIWPPRKTIWIIFSIRCIHVTSMKFLKVTLLEISYSQAIHKNITIWPLVTPNDLWPPLKPLWLLLLIGGIRTSIIKRIHGSKLKILCKQGFVPLNSPSWIRACRYDLWPNFPDPHYEPHHPFISVSNFHENLSSHVLMRLLWKIVDNHTPKCVCGGR